MIVISADAKKKHKTDYMILLAIMVTLTVIIVCQVTPYMKSFRMGKDRQLVDAVYTTLENILTNESIEEDLHFTYGSPVTETEKQIQAKLEQALGLNGTQLKKELASSIVKGKEIELIYKKSEAFIEVSVIGLPDEQEIRFSNQ